MAIEVEIFQLPDGHPLKFLVYRYFPLNSFKREDYFLVYYCYREDAYTQDDAFEEFNSRLPSDFRGHSLSVGDIVSINGQEFFCDSIGWIPVVDGQLVALRKD